MMSNNGTRPKRSIIDDKAEKILILNTWLVFPSAIKVVVNKFMKENKIVETDNIAKEEAPET